MCVPLNSLALPPLPSSCLMDRLLSDILDLEFYRYCCDFLFKWRRFNGTEVEPPSFEEWHSQTSELREERLVLAAREEGRRVGLKEGLQRARAEVGFIDIAADGFVTPPTVTQLDSLYGDGETSYNEGDVLESEPPLPHLMPFEPSSSTRHSSPQPQDYPPPPPLPHPSAPIQTAPVAPPLPSTMTGQIHPVIVHNIPPFPRHPPINIPPDGMIPADRPFFGFTISPPHELSPMPLIMGLPPPSRPIPEEPRIFPPPVPQRASMYASYSDYHPGHTYRGQSSPESNSTAISQFDMLAEPHSMMANISPMSVIPEAMSGFTSPNPPSMHGGELHRSSSMATFALMIKRNGSPVRVVAGQHSHLCKLVSATLENRDVLGHAHH
ncbi:hypothetical protein BT96DRAFT_938091 [Gymnopus androsaceus JB14]|uniref:Uncharacterized protein n=1 Tax=Gymnopus androsaceus JB14 TaxID=1447944 RepID=A0A6A4HTH2_9AGAR|nr:hypothetical protein BT96DRAFT_938091 [Gymnopus androsaceus JB14]